MLRTETLPVYDPWFADGTLNYYYGGWFLLSAPARLLRTSPALVMNLALAVFGSCASGAAFSLGAASDASPDPVAAAFAQPADQLARRALAVGFVLLLAAATVLRPSGSALTGSGPSGAVDWWAMSRVIPDSVAITEFPAWSLLFGDVHPHVMGIAVLLAVGASVRRLVRRARRRPTRPRAGARRLLGSAIGLIRMTNTWDFPSPVDWPVAPVVLALWHGPVAAPVVPAGARCAVVRRVGAVRPARRGVRLGFDPATLRTPPSSWLEQFGLFAAVAQWWWCSTSAVRCALRDPCGVDHAAHLVVVGCGRVGRVPGGAAGLRDVRDHGVADDRCGWVAWRRESGRRRGCAGCPLGPLGSLSAG